MRRTRPLRFSTVFGAVAWVVFGCVALYDHIHKNPPNGPLIAGMFALTCWLLMQDD